MGYVNELHPETADRFNVATDPVETDKTLDYAVLEVLAILRSAMALSN